MDQFGNDFHDDSVRVKGMKYGFFRVTTEATPPVFCAKCLEEIHGGVQLVMVNKRIFHPECFKVSE